MIITVTIARPDTTVHFFDTTLAGYAEWDADFKAATTNFTEEASGDHLTLTLSFSVADNAAFQTVLTNHADYLKAEADRRAAAAITTTRTQDDETFTFTW